MKIKIILFLFSLSFFIAAAYVGFIAPRAGFCDLLIAVPKMSGDGISIKSLEEINGSKVNLTYENMYNKSAEALQSKGIVLIGTNASYPNVMKYGMSSGSFFTEKAADDGNNHAVLNEKAAFDIFGTLDAAGNEVHIDMRPYIVTGVIDDKDTENMKVFVPASFMESAEAVMINLAWSDGLTEEHIKNELKHIGISEFNYDFVNLGLVWKILKNNVIVSLELAHLGIAALVINRAVISAGGYWKEAARKYQEYYLAELLRNETKLVQKLAVLIIAAVLLIFTVPAVILDLSEKYIEWNRAEEAFGAINYIGFGINTAEAENLYFLSNILVIGFILAFSIFVMDSLKVSRS